jgi:hypothetical protein
VIHKAGLRIVSGSCPTVGLVGGFHQGGHSSITSTHGMGADQALEWEVVLADGTLNNGHADQEPGSVLGA